MFKIGRLAELCGVNIKTIRFYEEEGLLFPVSVDRWTGYRYYDENSVERLSEILYLKELGFSLKEIKNFSHEQLKAKTLQIRQQISRLQNSLKILNSLSENSEGENEMKEFVNDEKVVGRWKKVGVSSDKERFLETLEPDSQIFPFEELYFLPGGEKYWVLSWTKGILFVNEQMNPYKIIDGYLLVGIRDNRDGSICDYAVFEKLDSEKHKRENIRIKDNLNLPFVNDEDVPGLWVVVDLVKNPAQFNPSKKFWRRWNEAVLSGYELFENGEGKIMFKNGRAFPVKWTQGLILEERDSLASAYSISEISGKKYMIVEWKSGDYIFGGKINCYYVLIKK